MDKFDVYNDSIDFTLSVDEMMPWLLKSAKNASTGTDWKASVQDFNINLMGNLYKIYHRLANRNYIQTATKSFILNDRGRVRLIRPLHVTDRIVQRAFCDFVFFPIIKNKLIYDNGASVEGKGISFSRSRMHCHLERALRKYNRNAYILQMDFSKFFDNIPHYELKEVVMPLLNNDFERWLFNKMVNRFKLDVSYMSDEEFEFYKNNVFNSLEHKRITHSDKSKILEKGLGVGSQISQLCGIFYPTSFDNYIKMNLKEKYYGRYMDDCYIISDSKNRLYEELELLSDKANELKLFLNPKKCKVTKLSHGFTFLKIKYYITETNKIIKTPVARCFTRERRKLYHFRRFYENGIMPLFEIINNYRSWKGNYIKFDCYKSINNLDRIFLDLFGKELSNSSMKKFISL